MEIKTLENTTPEQLTTVFNEAFKDYEIPMHRSVDEIATKIAVENIDLRFSVGAFEGGRLVGFILHGVDRYNGAETVWNGGTGVIESARGQKLTVKMYAFVLPILQQRKAKRLVLEVLKANETAKAVYTRLGFVEMRLLLSYKGILPDKTKTLYNIELLKEYDLDILSSFEDARPCWQLSNAVMRNWGEAIIATGVKKGNEIIGFLLYNRVNKRVCRFGVHKGHRRQGIGTALFQHIGEQFDKQVTVVNVDGAEESVNAFLVSLGFTCFASQWEMEKKL